MDNKEYIDILSSKYSELKIKIQDRQKKIRELFNEIEQLQKSAENILDLLHAEGVEINHSDKKFIELRSISDLAYDFLLNESYLKPIHYIDLTNNIMSKGELIPGKNPHANLLSHISNDDRFIRVSPGTYGLKEWNIAPMVTKKRKSKRRARKGR